MPGDNGPSGRDAHENGSQAAEMAQEKASQAAGAAQERAQHAAGQAQARLREQIEQRSAQAASQVNEQASDLRSVGEALRSQGKDGPARAADQLAGYAERVGSYLQDKDAETLLSDAEDFGRRQPLAVAAGGLILGLATSRFVKASSRRRYRRGLTVSRPNGVYAQGAPPSAPAQPPAVTAGMAPGA
jgi:hypothetical protein